MSSSPPSVPNVGLPSTDSSSADTSLPPAAPSSSSASSSPPTIHPPSPPSISSSSLISSIPITLPPPTTTTSTSLSTSPNLDNGEEDPSPQPPASTGPALAVSTSPLPPISTSIPITATAPALPIVPSPAPLPSTTLSTTNGITPPPVLAGGAPLAHATATRSFGLPGPPQTVNKSITPNYTIRKTTRPVVPYSSAAPAPVTPATPAPPATTTATSNPTTASAIPGIASGGGVVNSQGGGTGVGGGGSIGAVAPQQQPQQQQPQQQQNQQQQAVGATPTYPALHLTPLNDTFVPKQISLHPPGTKVKIGRQTNAKTVPNGTNGYFDSKVLSRMHAEVWSEDGKVFIKDVKSSNGTFINGDRLSAEAAESDIFELHTDDTVEFGIDIVSDDTKTIVHHKVAAKVFLVMNPDDALASSREFNTWFRTVGETSSQIQRRNAKVPTTQGNNGFSFDHVLSRLQGEINKSRDTSTHLSDLGTALNDVHDTLGGGVPPPASFAQNSRVPPHLPNGVANAQAQSIASLQNQLNDTQNSLAGHVGKIRDLEGLLAEHEVLKREVGSLRKQMEDAQRDMEIMMRGRGSNNLSVGGGGRDGRESPIAALLEAQEAADDDDDTRSISSVDTIRINTAEQLASVASHASRPNGILSNGTLPSSSTSSTSSHDSPPSSSSITSSSSATSKGDDLARDKLIQDQAARLATLSTELDEANKLGQALRSQHAEASAAMRALEARLQGLEKAVEGRVAEAEGKVIQEFESKWNGWRTTFEESWKQERERERESWQSEREKLVAAVREWEERKKSDLLETSDWSSSGEEDEEGADEPPSSSSTDPSSPFAPSGSSKGPKGKRPRSRRRRRSTATRVSILSLAAGGVASDSDSTVGDPSKSGSTDSWSGSQRGAPAGGPKGGFDDHGRPYGGGTSHAIPLASAGAVVLIGVVTAWALSIKLKES